MFELQFQNDLLNFSTISSSLNIFLYAGTSWEYSIGGHWISPVQSVPRRCK